MKTIYFTTSSLVVICFLVFVSIINISCQTSQGVSETKSSLYDKKYLAAFKKSTKKSTLYDNFATVFKVHTSSFSKEFLDLFKDKYYGIFPAAKGDERNILAEIGSKTAFVVSIYSPDGNLMNLNNKKQWNVYIEEEGKKKFPFKFIRLKKKK